MRAPKARAPSVSEAKLWENQGKKKGPPVCRRLGPCSRREYEGEAGTPILHPEPAPFHAPEGGFSARRIGYCPRLVVGEVAEWLKAAPC